MRSRVFLAAVLLVLVVPMPNASALTRTATFAPTSDIQPATSFSVNGCTYSTRHTCVDEIPPGPHDGGTTRLTSNRTQDESQIDLAVYWRLDPEDSVRGVRIHLVATTLISSWPVGAALSIFIQEYVGGGTYCFGGVLTISPPPISQGSYIDFSYPAGFDASCENSEVNTWEIVLVLACNTPPDCTNYLRITAIYIEILYTDRLGFPSTGGNFAWIIYAILIGSGCLVAAWRIKKWRETL